MKESYVRSKVHLKPLNNADFMKEIQPQNYQECEEQRPSSYKKEANVDITDLFDWSKPSEIVALNQPRQTSNNQSQLVQEPEVIQNNSMNTEQLLRSEEDEGERAFEEEVHLDDSIEQQSPILAPRQSYMQQVRGDYGSEYKLMTPIKLEHELRQMRDQILDMNSNLNKMLDRYELMAGTSNKSKPQVGYPYQLLSKQIELNSKLIDKQKLHLKQLDEKDQELEQKDYLVELSELIIKIKKEIHDLEKEKHGQEVGVAKINKLLKQVELVQEEGDEFKEVKELKHQIVFYFNRLNEQKMAEVQLDRDMDQLVQRQTGISQSLYSMSKVAAQKCLEVSANKPYVELKKRYDELVAASEIRRKKKEVTVRGFRGVYQKLEKENSAFRREIQRCQIGTQELEYRSQGFDEESNDIVTKNNVLSRELRSISYKFDQSLIHPGKGKFKPDFKRALSKMEGGMVNHTIDATNMDKQYSSTNDKNCLPRQVQECIKNGESSSPANSRMKPILRSWKGRKETPRYLGSPQKFNTIEGSNIFKPSLLNKSRQ